MTKNLILDSVQDLKQEYDVTIAFDIIFMENWMALLGVVHPMIYSETMEIFSRTRDELVQKMTSLIERIKSKSGVRKVSMVYVDGEKAINHLSGVADILQVKLEQSTPYRHNSLVEPYVRDMRNGQRANLGEYPFLTTTMVSKLAWKQSVQNFNYLPNEFTGAYLPIQVINKNQTYKTPVRFGRIVYVHNPDTTRGPEYPRRIPAVIVGYQESSKNSLVKLPGKSNILLRGGLVPIPEKDAVNIFLQFGNDVSLSAESDIWNDLDEDEQHVQIVHETGEFERYVPYKNALDDVEEKFTDTHLVNFMDVGTKLQTITGSSPLDGINRDGTEFLVYLTQSNETKNLQLKNTEVMEVVLVGISLEDQEYEQDLKAKSKIRGEIGKRAAGKLELFKLLKRYNAMEPCHVPWNKRHLVVPSSLLHTEKKDSNGDVVENKGRLVALGNKRQEIIEMLEKFSPTVNFGTILLVLNLILIGDLDYAVVDVSSAYVQSPIVRETYVHINKKVTQLMVEVDPRVSKYVRKDGSLDMKLIKSLYGLEESSKLWQKFLTKTLVDMGYKVHPLDEGFFYKDELVNGKLKRILIIAYVDDLLIAGNRGQLESFIDSFGSKFDIKFSAISPEVIEFLKIKIKRDAKDKSFQLSQPGYISSLVEGAGVTGTRDMPHIRSKLLDTSPSPLLDNPTEFRSAVMGAVYASRVRLDVKATLCYLTTKSQSPTQRDMENVKILLEYLNSTKDFALRIKPERVQISATADASWGSHTDGKSTTGMTVTFGGAGNAPLICKSTKQKAVAQSTATSELIATTAAVEEALWVKQMLKPLGYDMNDPIVVENDNRSTQALLTKGPSSSGRLKWVDVKSFWVREHMESGEIKLSYTPSLDLLSDGLTKPLDRKLFFKFRARILNFVSN